MKHTPGKWTMKKRSDGKVYLIDAPEQFIAEVDNDDINKEEAAANARLIIKAVNNFDAVLEALESAYALSCARSESRKIWTISDQKVHEQLKQAIAKVKEE